jgi:hypothetical protein
MPLLVTLTACASAPSVLVTAPVAIGDGPLLVVRTGPRDEPALQVVDLERSGPAGECVRQYEDAALHSLEPVQRLDRTHLLVQLQGVMSQLCVVDLERGTSRGLAVTRSWVCGACADGILSFGPEDWHLKISDWRGDGVARDLELRSSDAAVPPPPRFARACVVDGACFAIGVRDAYELWRIDLATRTAARITLLPDWSQSAQLSASSDRRFVALLTRAEGAPHDLAPVQVPDRMPRLAHMWRMRVFDGATGALSRDWSDVAVDAFVISSHEMAPVVAWNGSAVTVHVLRTSPAAASDSPAWATIVFLSRDAATGAEQPASAPVRDGPQTCTTGDGRFAITRSADGRVEVLDGVRNERRVVAEGASAYWLLPRP